MLNAFFHTWIGRTIERSGKYIFHFRMPCEKYLYHKLINTCNWVYWQRLVYFLFLFFYCYAIYDPTPDRYSRYSQYFWPEIGLLFEYFIVASTMTSLLLCVRCIWCCCCICNVSTWKIIFFAHIECGPLWMCYAQIVCTIHISIQCSQTIIHNCVSFLSDIWSGDCLVLQNCRDFSWINMNYVWILNSGYPHWRGNAAVLVSIPILKSLHRKRGKKKKKTLFNF